MKNEWKMWDTIQWCAALLCIVAFVLLCQWCDAENLPDAPSATAKAQPSPSTWHELRLPLTTMWATNAADIGITCSVLANGGHEDFLPTQSCGGAAAILVGERVAITGMAWILARKGHPNLAKGLLWATTGSNGYAIGYTAMHWHEPNPKVQPLPPTSAIIVQGGIK